MVPFNTAYVLNMQTSEILSRMPDNVQSWNNGVSLQEQLEQWGFFTRAAGTMGFLYKSSWNNGVSLQEQPNSFTFASSSTLFFLKKEVTWVQNVTIEMQQTCSPY